MAMFPAKKGQQEYFCALCRTPRILTIPRHLSWINYCQIVLLAGAFCALTWTVLGPKVLLSLFPIWATFEASRKILYRRELKCTICGFDPTWYRRDVRLARQKVETYLQQNPDSPVFRQRARQDAEKFKTTH